MRFTTLKFTSILMFVLLVAVSCQKREAVTFSDAMQAQLAQLPQNAQVYGYMDVEQVRHSPFFSTFVESEQWPAEREFEEFREHTGIDPRKAVQKFYVAGMRPEGSKHWRGIMVADGKFERKKIEAYLKEEDAKDGKQDWRQTTIAGQSVHLFEEEDLALAFPEPNRIVLAHPTLMKTYFERAAGDDENSLNPELSKRLNRIKYKKQMWLSLDTQTLMADIHEKIPTDKWQGLRSIRYMDMSMKLSDQMQMDAVGMFSKTEPAKLFKDAIKGALATLKLAVSDDRRIVDILNKIDIKAEGKTLKIDFSLSKEEMQKLLERREKLTTRII